jgi:pullulanase/glycogen debranching enzyme
MGGANYRFDTETTGGAHLLALGINALELLPPADSAHDRAWGYGTSHFLAPDHDLGFPEGHDHPTSNRDLSALVQTCHAEGIRFLVDVVTAFGKDESYSHAAFPDFYIGDARRLPDDDIDKWTSVRGSGHREVRDGFGSNLFRHSREIEGYDPVSGAMRQVHPSRALMEVALDRWMRDFGVDGIRMDSIENVANWDFVQEYRDRAHLRFGKGAGERFLVIGEEISMPMDLLDQGRVDALWNDPFRARVRAAILGEGFEGRSFEATVREMIDCRQLGFRDATQAVNYVTSHDVEGYRRERLFNFLREEGLDAEATGRRIKLAFACLLTAVGIPMILAGEEFADQHDRFDADGNVSQGGGKQIDPVDFSRLHNPSSPLQPMRQEVFEFVARLVRLRTSHLALGSDEVRFLHADFLPGRRLMAWQRGPSSDPVVVVANFSDFRSEGEYVVQNWPSVPPGRRWRDVSQDREVDPAWVGREAVFPWEAKVYASG